jgi:hypothetical protein
MSALVLWLVTLYLGRAMAQVVKSLASHRAGLGSCPGLSMWDLWTKWHLSSSVFPCQYHSIVALQTHIIWGMRNLLT